MKKVILHKSNGKTKQKSRSETCNKKTTTKRGKREKIIIRHHKT